MPHDLVELTRRWFREVWDQGRANVIDEMLAPHAKIHGLGNQPLDAAQFKAFYQTFQAAFSEIRVEVAECLADADRSACVFFFHARHTGESLGIPSTQKPVRVMGMALVRWRDGKMVEAFNQFDHPGMMQQLGPAK